MGKGYFINRRSVLLTLAALLLIVSGCSTNSGGKVNIGSDAPQFTLASNLGRDVRLIDYRGKIVIIDFWATWCPPCRRGIPDLISIQSEYKNDVVVIGICTDKTDKSNVLDFVQSTGINYPIVYSTDEVESAYGNISAIPTSFIIDRHGVITASHVGLVSRNVYTEKIKTLL